MQRVFQEPERNLKVNGRKTVKKGLGIVSTLVYWAFIVAIVTMVMQNI